MQDRTRFSVKYLTTVGAYSLVEILNFTMKDCVLKRFNDSENNNLINFEFLWCKYSNCYNFAKFDWHYNIADCIYLFYIVCQWKSINIKGIWSMWMIAQCFTRFVYRCLRRMWHMIWNESEFQLNSQELLITSIRMRSFYFKPIDSCRWLWNYHSINLHKYWFLPSFFVLRLLLECNQYDYYLQKISIRTRME